MPYSTKNNVIVMLEKVEFLNIRRSGKGSALLATFMGSRERIKTSAIRSRNTKMCPKARVAHTKPAKVNREESIKGKGRLLVSQHS